MNVTIEEVGPCKKKLKIEVDQERIQEEMDKGYRELSSTAVISGFRRGRVPRRLLEKRFGQQLQEEIRDNLLEEALREAVEENDLQPLGKAKFENVEFDPETKLSYEAILDVRPVFELGDYKGIEITREDVSEADYTGDRVTEVIDNMRQSRAELVLKEGTATADDFLACSVRIGEGDAILHEQESATIRISEGSVLGLPVPDLAEKAKGAKEEDTLQFQVELPEGFPNAEFAGKTVPMTLEVLDVLEMELPELTDAFAKEFDFDSLDEMREEVSVNLKSAKEEERESALRQSVVDKVVDQIKFELPEDLILHELQNFLERRRMQLLYSGTDEAEVASTLAEEEGKSREDIVGSLKAFFILDDIAKVEKVFVLESDVDDHIKTLAAREQVSVTQKRQDLEQRDLLSQLRLQIKEDKVRQFLLDNAKVTKA
ncbi:trigger factor [bacterium AH-315-F18]|nr:trigger factor [bacterium AH-315-F18]